MKPALLLLLIATTATAGTLLDDVRTAELGRRYDDELFRRAAASPDAAVRAAVARAGGQLRDERAVAWLLPLTRDEVGRVRRTALFALGQIGGDAILLPLRESLPTLARHDLPHALEAIGKSRDARGVATIVTYLSHRDPETRAQAALALFRIGDATAVTELTNQLARERDANARWTLVYACFRLLRTEAQKSDAAVPVDEAWQRILAPSLEPSRPFHERVFAARALGATRGAERWIAPLLADPDARVRIAALRGLAFAAPKEHAKAVAALLSDENTMVRDTAMDLFERWGKPAYEAFWTQVPAARDAAFALRVYRFEQSHAPDLQRLPPTGDRAAYEEFRCEAKELPRLAEIKTIRGLRALAEACGREEVEGKTARATLETLLQHEDMTVRVMAVGAVAARGWKDAAPALLASARSARGPDASDVRMEVAGALAELGVADAWLEDAALDPVFMVRDAARAAMKKLSMKVPPKRAPPGFRLHGMDAAAVWREARTLVGARVVVETSRGTMTLVLLPDEAPAHCVNFARLVSDGFYDGKRWHRVVPNFVIQGGCPRGDGWGGPGYTVPDEIGTRPYVRGTVGMPKAGDDTGGCQLFITHLPTPHLDGRYTVFAQVVQGMDVIDRMRVGDTIKRATLDVRR
ncbi:MAG: peptidylprolyl isomerase [Planctomycetota bacterium]